MRSRRILGALALGLLLAWGLAVADEQDSLDTQIEQQKALAAEQNPAPARTAQFPANMDAPGDMIFIGVDDTTVSTYAVFLLRALVNSSPSRFR